MKQILAITLALLILLLNLGLTLNTHYCGDVLAKSSITLGNDALGCGMEMEQVSCENSFHNGVIKKKSCCETEHFQLQVDEEHKHPENMSFQPKLDFLVVFVVSYFNNKLFGTPQINIQPNYISPHYHLDLEILNQVFLI